MINIRLAELSEKLKKNISEISRETGINRNAVTALFHNKVDGIKFSTLDRLCEQYGFNISDILEYMPNCKEEESDEADLIYIQEGDTVLFTGWFPAVRNCVLDKKFFDISFGENDIYVKNSYVFVFLRKGRMQDLARFAYNRYTDKQEFATLYSEYQDSALAIQNLYFSLEKSDILQMDRESFLNLFSKLKSYYYHFWDLSLFIDAFDSGFDQNKIKHISQEYNLLPEEVSILLNPVELTFNNERILDLLKIVRSYHGDDIRKWAMDNERVNSYIKKYDYYKSNYAKMNHISKEEAVGEIVSFWQDKKAAQDEYNKLINYSRNQEGRVSQVLKKYKLKENPLEFFARLTFWREHRKQTNLMGIHLLFFILNKIEIETGISGKYLEYLTPDEVSNVLNGLIGEAELENRYKQGVMLSVVGDRYKMLIGKEAESLRGELENRKEKKIESSDLYRQDGELILFTLWPPFFVWNSPDSEFLSGSMGRYEAYFRDNYAYGYFRRKDMWNMAESVYEKYSDLNKFDRFYSAYLSAAEKMSELYFKYDCDQVLLLSREDVSKFLKDLMTRYKKFWSLSLFIDTFDGGFDQDKIEKLVGQYGFTAQESVVLTSVEELTFNNERTLQIMEIAADFLKKSLGASLRKFVEEYVNNSNVIEKHIRDFDYYRSNYAQIDHITKKEITEEILKYLKDPDLLHSEIMRLRGYSNNIKIEKQKILNRHKLKENPLEFFARLTFWREHRKQINLMGIHLLFFIMEWASKKSKIPLDYIKSTTPDEIDDILDGKISVADLKRRKEDGFIFLVDENGHEIIYGSGADKIRDELEKQLSAGMQEETISGFVASQGYARGIARVVLGVSDFDKFQEGEILVTSMTRPEFLPLMKKAAGIVTNEGGITCHAAIVSRELNKPCIIGTQVATQFIKTGDLVEVRANHGTVRILRGIK